MIILQRYKCTAALGQLRFGAIHGFGRRLHRFGLTLLCLCRLRFRCRGLDHVFGIIPASQYTPSRTN